MSPNVDTPEADEPDLDPDAPGLHRWVERRLSATPAPPPSPLVRNMADPSSVWGQAAARAGIPPEQRREVLAALETAMLRQHDGAELADLAPDSPSVTTWLEAAAREHA